MPQCLRHKQLLATLTLCHPVHESWPVRSSQCKRGCQRCTAQPAQQHKQQTGSAGCLTDRLSPRAVHWEPDSAATLVGKAPVSSPLLEPSCFFNVSSAPAQQLGLDTGCLTLLPLLLARSGMKEPCTFQTTHDYICPHLLHPPCLLRVLGFVVTCQRNSLATVTQHTPEQRQTGRHTCGNIMAACGTPVAALNARMGRCTTACPSSAWGQRRPSAVPQQIYSCSRLDYVQCNCKQSLTCASCALTLSHPHWPHTVGCRVPAPHTP